MRELAIVVGLLVLFGLFAATALLDAFELVAWGRATMLWSIAVSVPAEVVYLAALAWALRGRDVPKGWIWRSYLFHDRMTRGEKWLVLPFFTLGWAAAAVASVGVFAVILGFVAGVRAG